MTTARGQSHPTALALLALLFFMWGFVTVLGDILVPHLKALFSLGTAGAMLVQFSFFGAYFVVGVPAGWLIARIGYRGGIVTGLLVASAGALSFALSSWLASYAAFLLALFVLAAGITVLQVAANPYVTLLGPPRTAASRLNLTQGINSLGTTLAPAVGAWLILGGAEGLGGAQGSGGGAAGAEPIQQGREALGIVALVRGAIAARCKQGALALVGPHQVPAAHHERRAQAAIAAQAAARVDHHGATSGVGVPALDLEADLDRRR
ncbi:MAG: hypothetical protein KDK70_11385, partial [Myxococcales bacterium]|nr:hypothetical protein [Myxococcales bacterium]